MKKPISITVDPEVLTSVDQFVDRYHGNFSRSFVIQRAVQHGMQHLEQDPGSLVSGL